MLELIKTGGPVMWALAGISLLAAILFFQKLLQLHRAQINTEDFLFGLYNVLRRGNTVEAVTICEDTPGPVARLVRAALLKVEESPSEIARSVQQAGLSEIPRLELRLNLLATLGKIAPMLGLLGTVLAMMDSLRVLQAQAPLAHVDDLADSLRVALVTSAAGLAIAMPIYAGYNLLVSRIESIVLDMEFAASDILSFLTTNRNLFTRD